MATKVTDLVGNSFRLKKNVTVHIGSPNSDRKTTWKSGTQTPLIYSWVEKNGDVWWQFGRQDPARFIKHDPAALDPIAERGAAEYLSSDLGGDRGRPGSNFLFSGFDFSDFTLPFKILAYAVAFYIGWKIYSLGK